MVTKKTNLDLHEEKTDELEKKLERKLEKIGYRKKINDIYDFLTKFSDKTELISSLEIEGNLDIIVNGIIKKEENIERKLTINPYNSTLIIHNENNEEQITYENLLFDNLRKNKLYFTTKNSDISILLNEIDYKKTLIEDSEWIKLEKELIESMIKGKLKLYDYWVKELCIVNTGLIYFAESYQKNSSFIITPSIKRRKGDEISYENNIIVEFATYNKRKPKFLFEETTEIIQTKENFKNLYIYTIEGNIPFEKSAEFVSKILGYIKRLNPIKIEKSYFFPF